MKRTWGWWLTVAVVGLVPMMALADDFEDGRRIGERCGQVLGPVLIALFIFHLWYRDPPIGIERPVGPLLGLGLVFFPYIFGWLMIQPGRSWVARGATLAWGVLMVIGLVASINARSGLPGEDGSFTSTFEAGFVRGCESRGADKAFCECMAKDAVANLSIKAMERLADDQRKGNPPSDEARAWLEQGVARCRVGGSGREGISPLGALKPSSLSDDRQLTAKSPDGKATLKQASASSTECDISCTVELADGKETWKTKTSCFARVADSVFVANDCERAIIVYSSPGGGRISEATPVARVLKRAKPDWDIALVTVVNAFQNIHGSLWLKERAHYSSDGRSVELDSTDGKHSSIPLYAEENEGK